MSFQGLSRTKNIRFSLSPHSRPIPHPLPYPTLKISIAPKLITQALRMLRIKIRRLGANLLIQLLNQLSHSLSRADDQTEGVLPIRRRPGFGEPAYCQCSWDELDESEVMRIGYLNVPFV